MVSDKTTFLLLRAVSLSAISGYFKNLGSSSVMYDIDCKSILQKLSSWFFRFCNERSFPVVVMYDVARLSSKIIGHQRKTSGVDMSQL